MHLHFDGFLFVVPNALRTPSPIVGDLAPAVPVALPAVGPPDSAVGPPDSGLTTERTLDNVGISRRLEIRNAIRHIQATVLPLKQSGSLQIADPVPFR